ncbi:MAG: hypothetical protein M3Q12_01185 [Pseudomonadota bacterium]|nr:hypothetical protein [Pseudomonadota bacterium]
MTNAYFRTVNENGGGYVKRAPATRSTAQVESELFDAECDLKSAKVAADCNDGQDGTAYKVERLAKQIADLRAELAEGK